MFKHSEPDVCEIRWISIIYLKVYASHAIILASVICVNSGQLFLDISELSSCIFKAILFLNLRNLVIFILLTLKTYLDCIDFQYADFNCFTALINDYSAWHIIV